jgi:hypothetical protein
MLMLPARRRQGCSRRGRFQQLSSRAHETHDYTACLHVERAFWPATSAFLPTFFRLGRARRRMFTRLEPLAQRTRDSPASRWIQTRR